MFSPCARRAAAPLPGCCCFTACAVSHSLAKSLNRDGGRARLTQELPRDSQVLLPSVGNARRKKIPSSCIRAVCHSCAICSTCNINQQPVVRSDSSAFDGYGESQINKLYAASGLSVRFLSSSVVHLHGQSALQGKRRCPSLLLVFWGSPAFPAQGWDAGAGAPRRGPAERGACQPECLAEKMLDFGLRSLPWQLLCFPQRSHWVVRSCGSLEGDCQLDPSAVVYYEIIAQLRMTQMPGEASAASASLQITSAALL